MEALIIVPLIMVGMLFLGKSINPAHSKNQESPGSLFLIGVLLVGSFMLLGPFALVLWFILYCFCGGNKK